MTSRLIHGRHVFTPTQVAALAKAATGPVTPVRVRELEVVSGKATYPVVPALWFTAAPTSYAAAVRFMWGGRLPAVWRRALPRGGRPMTHSWLLLPVSLLVACSGTTPVASAPSATTATPPATMLASPPTASPAVVVSHVPSAGPGQGVITVALFRAAQTRLVLHAGFAQPTTSGDWQNGPVVTGAERAQLLAAFEGGFKMAGAHGGWLSEGRTVVPLRPGAASVVVYADGRTDIGRWGAEVPTPGQRVASVRQNLSLLVDHGRAGPVVTVDQAQLEQVWGKTFHHEPLVSRSALGVTAGGDLLWVAGTRVTVPALAQALLLHHVVRALQLDINAPLVRGFRFSGSAVVPLVVGQTQLAADRGATDAKVAPHCTYVVPCSRDFFTVVRR